jgi:hypothetical protein
MERGINFGPWGFIIFESKIIAFIYIVTGCFWILCIDTFEVAFSINLVYGFSLYLYYIYLLLN